MTRQHSQSQSNPPANELEKVTGNIQSIIAPDEPFNPDPEINPETPEPEIPTQPPDPNISPPSPSPVNPTSPTELPPHIEPVRTEI